MPDERQPFHTPFAALRRLRGVPEDEPLSPESTPATQPRPSPEGRAPARAVVRIERSGRGGKEVTVIAHLGLPAPALAAWLKALKSSLGCGGTVEGDAIVLQGDQRKRAPALLSKRGVKRVTVA